MTDRVKESRIIKTLKFRSKTKAICRWAYKVSCGNEYLAVFARQFASRVFIIPTTVDTDLHIPKEGNSGRTIVGWTGSHSTLKYLEKIEPVLIELTTAFPKIEIMVIADRPPVFSKIQCTFHTWNAATEIEDLQNFDIGMMPLPDDEWSKGKCGFKALQYMALGIPAVASAVGENMKIIQHGVNGFLVSSEEEWLNCLSMLLRDPALCKRIGEAGRKRVLDHYSVVSNRSAFLNLFT
jgi:glycosyltransferase involved in cell wall biosynthesis